MAASALAAASASTSAYTQSLACPHTSYPALAMLARRSVPASTQCLHHVATFSAVLPPLSISASSLLPPLLTSSLYTLTCS